MIVDYCSRRRVPLWATNVSPPTAARQMADHATPSVCGAFRERVPPALDPAVVHATPPTLIVGVDIPASQLSLRRRKVKRRPGLDEYRRDVIRGSRLSSWSTPARRAQQNGPCT